MPIDFQVALNSLPSHSLFPVHKQLPANFSPHLFQAKSEKILKLFCELCIMFGKLMITIWERYAKCF